MGLLFYISREGIVAKAAIPKIWLMVGLDGQRIHVSNCEQVSEKAPRRQRSHSSEQSKSCTYVLSVGEKADSPEYSYQGVRTKVNEIDETMLK